jgi:hypothetical protein
VDRRGWGCIVGGGMGGRDIGVVSVVPPLVPPLGYCTWRGFFASTVPLRLRGFGRFGFPAEINSPLVFQHASGMTHLRTDIEYF